MKLGYVLVIVGGWAMQWGCGGDTVVEGAPADAGMGWVEVGVGLPFEPVDDGDTVALILGPAGGVYIEINARMSGLYPGQVEENRDAPATQCDVFDEDGTQWDLPLGPFAVSYVEDGLGAYVMHSSRYLFMDYEAIEALDGQRAEMRLVITDVQGAVARDSRWVMVEAVWR